MDFWTEVATGYDLIKNKDYKGVLSVVSKLKSIKGSDDEDLAISALEAWSFLFAKDFDELIPITSRMIVCKQGGMPAWYRGLGYILQGLVHLNLSSNQRFNLFQKAADNYNSHIINEIPKISSPSTSSVNTVISTYFQGLCILEATGSLEILDDLLAELYKNQYSILHSPIQGIIKAVKLQIKIKRENYSKKLIQDNLDIKDESDDPLYYCNLIIRLSN